MSARTLEIDFVGYAPGFDGGVKSPRDAGWFVSIHEKTEGGKWRDRRLSGPHRTYREAAIVLDALASRRNA